MINRILNTLSDVSLTKKSGKFLSDKSYGFDTIFFISKFIKHNSLNRMFNKAKLRTRAIKYIEDIFQLKSGTAGAVNYFLETVNLLEFANVVKKISKTEYVIEDIEILDFIIECPENSYIFVYLLTYKTYVNDGIMPLYQRYCDGKDNGRKSQIVLDIHKMFIDKSISIKDDGKSNWSKQLVKYSFIVLGYINRQNIITRTLNITRVANIEDISLNVEGTRTPLYLPKKNDYLKMFNDSYVEYYLKPYMLRTVKVSGKFDLTRVDSIAQSLADLKLVMQDETVNGVRMNEFEKQQYIVNSVKTRNQVIQRQFRKNLLDNNEHKCPICGFSFEEFLIASHIKPYSKCEDTYDAINHYNGLLLCPNHDRLFEDMKEGII